MRVEFPAEIYEPIESIMYDAKLRVRTRTYDDMVRTFCTNPRGFVVREDFDDFALVNGHAENKRKSKNTNFALLVHVELTDPVEDTTQYGRAIAELATTIGGGRPILQRLKVEQGRLARRLAAVLDRDLPGERVEIDVPTRKDHTDPLS